MGVPYLENAEGIDSPDGHPGSTNNARPRSTRSGHKGRSRILGSAVPPPGPLPSSGDADAADAFQPPEGLGPGEPLSGQLGQGPGQAPQGEFGVLGQIFCHEPLKLEHMLVEVLDNGRVWQGMLGVRARAGKRRHQ